MTAEDRFIEDRQIRNEARAVFDAELQQVKADLKARSIPGRVVDSAKHEASEAIATGLEVANESKGIIAAIAAAIGLWVFRAPLLGWFGSLGSGDKQSAIHPDYDSAADDEE